MKNTSLLLIISSFIVSTISCSIQKPAEQKIKLFDQKWSLIELNGRSIEGMTSLQSPAFLQFNENENKITGNGSCNNFFGNFKLMENDGIHISQLGATRMHCENMQVETDLMNTLQKASNYKIEKDVLIFSNPEKTSTARFKLESQQNQ